MYQIGRKSWSLRTYKQNTADKRKHSVPGSAVDEEAILRTNVFKIDFDYQHVVINSQCVKPETRALLGVVINSSSIEDNNAKLDPRVEMIHLTDWDTNE